ncbi:MAG: NnrS family protein [Gammaproteobacteria bacterium]|nr:NnrS family protein [Gammaproteobacteria bacterium]MDH3415809.1 NnrS family protein [Gammaproteobacteria bacterium]
MGTAQQKNKPTAMALLALGFRPFYLLAAVFAIVAIPAWLVSYAGGDLAGNYLQGIAWHSHEMIFGFAAAVIAGFLLTAVRNWTGRPTPTGALLGGLVTLWLLARVLMLTGPANAAALIDILFLPALAIAIAIPIWAGRNVRNYKVLAVLGVLTLANVGYHLASSGSLPIGFGRVSMTAALDVISILIAIVGGRVVPAFIGNAVEEARPRHIKSVEIVSVGALIVILVAGVVKAWIAVAPIAFLIILVVAAVGQGVRLLLWQPFRARGNPLLWMLPVAYAWLPVSLALRALELQSIVPSGTAIHALTIGAIASLMMAMMMRSALGHSGRPLVAGLAEVGAFVLLQLSAIVRILAASIAPGAYREAMIVSGVLWTLAFAVFLWRYWPVLTRPRIDGRPG